MDEYQIFLNYSINNFHDMGCLLEYFEIITKNFHLKTWPTTMNYEELVPIVKYINIFVNCARVDELHILKGHHDMKFHKKLEFLNFDHKYRINMLKNFSDTEEVIKNVDILYERNSDKEEALRQCKVILFLITEGYIKSGVFSKQLKEAVRSGKPIFFALLDKNNLNEYIKHESNVNLRRNYIDIDVEEFYRRFRIKPWETDSIFDLSNIFYYKSVYKGFDCEEHKMYSKMAKILNTPSDSSFQVRLIFASIDISIYFS